MPKRSKRLKKGIESIRDQIELHKQKLRAAQKSGNIGLSDYYEKEIESLEAAIRKKQKILGSK
jgi:peptidoglycan hydrolase CwlO-like protein